PHGFGPRVLRRRGRRSRFPRHLSAARRPWPRPPPAGAVPGPVLGWAHDLQQRTGPSPAPAAAHAVRDRRGRAGSLAPSHDGRRRPARPARRGAARVAQLLHDGSRRHAQHGVTRRTLPGGYELDDDPARIDVDAVHRYLSGESYWASGRARPVTERLVREATRVVGLYRDGDLVGFCRAVSHHATFPSLTTHF